MSNYPWAYSDPIDGEGMDDEDHATYCEHCGDEMDWEDCDQCGGEGEFGWETLQFEDPLWYSEDDIEMCEQCEGMGGWWLCRNTTCVPVEETSR